MDQMGPSRLFQPHSYEHYKVSRTLRDSHAFDRGDNKALDWIDRQRREIGGGAPYDYYEESTWQTEGYEADGYYEDVSYGRLYSIPSDSSSYIQAADIAAGFARQDYERYGVAAVAGSFEYVTINGERITQDNAEQRFEYWRELIEREQRTVLLVKLTRNSEEFYMRRA